MPNVPDRPGHHRAAHKAASRVARLRTKLRVPHLPSLSVPTPAAGLRRHAGTVAALGGVLVAGIAASGSTFDGHQTTAHAAGAEKQPWNTGAEITGTDAGDRENPSLAQTSRSSIRKQIEQLRPTDHQTQSELGGGGVSSAEELMPTDPREIALELLPQYGWDSSQFGCLDELWVGESDWDVNATNPTSGAYGIPQALPAEKMASFGSDWRTNPVTQIEWGLWYINESYGSPCSANEFKNANNWY